MTAARLVSPAIWIFVAGLVLSVPAIWNGFPLVFVDSADYLVFTPQLHRSPFYAVLAFMAHWRIDPWPVVLLQSLIVAHLVFLLLRVHLERVESAVYLAVIVVLTGATAAPWFSGQLMPDVFTPVLMLTIYLLGLHLERLGRIERLYLAGLLLAAISAHVSHLAAALGLFLLVTVMLGIERRSLKRIAAPLGLIGVPIALNAAAFYAFFALIHGVPALSPAGPVFLAANLIASGPARDHLAEVCPDAGFAICAHVDDLPDDANTFLWRPGNVLGQVGGFGGFRDEARMIVFETVRNRPGEVAATAFHQFLEQLVTVSPRQELRSRLHAENLTSLIAEHFGPGAAAAYVGSRQSRNALPLDALAAVQHAALLLALGGAVSIMLVAVRRRWHDVSHGLVFLACCLAGNAFMMGVLSGVYPRYQGRVAWLLVLFTIVFGLLAWGRRGARARHGIAAEPEAAA